MGVGELVVVGRDLTYLESGKKPRLTLSTICLWVRVRALELYYMGPSTQNPIPVLCIFRISGRIRYLIKWGCDSMASCPDPTTHMLCVLGQVICTFLT